MSVSSATIRTSSDLLRKLVSACWSFEMRFHAAMGSRSSRWPAPNTNSSYSVNDISASCALALHGHCVPTHRNAPLALRSIKILLIGLRAEEAVAINFGSTLDNALVFSSAQKLMSASTLFILNFANGDTQVSCSLLASA